jgi:hypothetical protein
LQWQTLLAATVVQTLSAIDSRIVVSPPYRQFGDRWRQQNSFVPGNTLALTDKRFYVHRAAIMDVSQPLVIRMSQVIPAFDRILQHHISLDEACLTEHAYTRLLAYELMTLPEVLDYNPTILTADKRVYTAQTTGGTTTTSAEKGCPIIRATPLQVASALMKHAQAPRDIQHMMDDIVAQTHQHQCCWFNGPMRKACSARGIAIPTKSHHYVFCFKHWAYTLRQGVNEGVPIAPTSELSLDEWLACIV